MDSAPAATRMPPQLSQAAVGTPGGPIIGMGPVRVIAHDAHPGEQEARMHHMVIRDVTAVIQRPPVEEAGELGFGTRSRVSIYIQREGLAEPMLIECITPLHPGTERSQ